MLLRSLTHYGNSTSEMLAALRAKFNTNANPLCRTDSSIGLMQGTRMDGENAEWIRAQNAAIYKAFFSKKIDE
jgi:hypothetical protein